MFQLQTRSKPILDLLPGLRSEGGIMKIKVSGCSINLDCDKECPLAEIYAVAKYSELVDIDSERFGEVDIITIEALSTTDEDEFEALIERIKEEAKKCELIKLKLR